MQNGRASPLPGDQATIDRPTYWIQHTITIDAPVAAVWPWLAQPASFAGILFAWADIALFQPAHFIMERGMLRGVKSRAERAHTADADTGQRS